MSGPVLVTLRRRPKPNGGHHFMFVDGSGRAGFVGADQVPPFMADDIVADVQMVPARHWPRWAVVEVYPFNWQVRSAEASV